MYRVLIVDDESVIRLGIKSIINNLNGDFIVSAMASNGAIALKLIDKLSPHIIITDLVMPKIDGIQLIEAVSKKKLFTKIIVISNYDDFNLVKSAMKLGAFDYMLKLNLSEETLLKVLNASACELELERKEYSELQQNEITKQSNQNMLRKIYIKELILDSSHTLQSNIGQSPYNIFDNNKFNMIYLEIDAYHEYFRDDSEKSKDSFGRTMIDIVDDIMSNVNIKYTIEVMSGVFIILLEFEKLNICISSLCHRISRDIKQYINVLTTIVYSNEYITIQNITQIYARTTTKAKEKFYSGSGNIFNLEEPQKSPSNTYVSEIFDGIFKNIIESMRMCNEQSVLDNIDELIQFIKKEQTPAELVLKYTEILIAYIRRSLDENTFVNSVAFKNCEAIGNYKNILTEVLFHIYDDYIKNEVDTQKTEVISIIKYINRHLNEKIELHQISEEIKMNTSYLCRLFKNETGITIMQYITDKRMTKAAELLSNTDKKMFEIASEVGLSDALYFSKIFKKYYNISPTDFRQKRNDGSIKLRPIN